MDDDSFDNLLDLEENFFKEGYDEGMKDGHDAGLIEGKIFGIEKAYEKALELGKLHGRGMLWNKRLPLTTTRIEGKTLSLQQDPKTQGHPTLETAAVHLETLPDNARLRKHIEALLSTTDRTTVDDNNSDEAVADFEERITRATAKAKVISQVIGEAFNPLRGEQTAIEDSMGLSARH